MSKEEIIHAIRRRNRSAAEPFLASFSLPHLADYLQRLNAVHGGSPALAMRMTGNLAFARRDA